MTKGNTMSEIPKTCGECVPHYASVGGDFEECCHPEKEFMVGNVNGNAAPPTDCPLRREKLTHAGKPNHKSRLVYRFLMLPFRHQLAVANNIDVLTDADRTLDDMALFRVLFKRAYEKGLLAKLWAETEKLHDDPATFNPFEKTDEQPKPLDVVGICDEARREVFKQTYPNLCEQSDTVPVTALDACDDDCECAKSMNGFPVECEAQPDLLPVPPKAERDGVWVSREKYDRMRALCEAAVAWAEAEHAVASDQKPVQFLRYHEGMLRIAAHGERQRRIDAETKGGE